MKKFFLILFAAAVIIGGAFLITFTQPQAALQEDENAYQSIEDKTAILRESEALEAEFVKKRDLMNVSEEDVEKLRRAIRLRETYISITGSTDRLQNSRFVNLQAMMQNVEAKPLAERVASLEANAANNEDARPPKELLALYGEIYEIQNKINREFPLSDFKNVQKTLSYERKMRAVEARPLYDESLKAEKAARAAEERKDWLAAQANYVLAIEKIRKLDVDFPNTIYSDPQRIRMMESQMDTLKSAPLFQKLGEQTAAAKAAAGKTEFIEASEHYGEAAATQQSINKLYPKSLHASEDNFKSLVNLRDSTFSARFGKEILSQKKELDSAVREGRYEDVIGATASIISKIERYQKEFKESKIISEDTVLEIKYLNFMARSLPEIREELDKNLLQLASFPDVRMCKTEIPQALYSKIMQSNPSRVHADSLPVESVILEDVENFCKRVSWIMGRKVSLPSLEMYKSGLGSLKYVDINAISWNVDNSDLKPHEVATKEPSASGFFDILGNVSELAAETRNGQTVIYEVGGNAQSSTNALADFPAELQQNISRSRMLGFRIVVFDK